MAHVNQNCGACPARHTKPRDDLHGAAPIVSYTCRHPDAPGPTEADPTAPWIGFLDRKPAWCPLQLEPERKLENPPDALRQATLF